MNYREFRKYFTDALSVRYDADEAEAIFYRLLDYRHGLTRMDLAVRPIALSADVEMQWNRDLDELKSGNPVQYIIGKTSFYGLDFEVSPAVLIPRPETEELVDWIVRSDAPKQTILDLCTGSGCIAVSLAKNLNGEVVAVDVSQDALKVAARNAEINQVKVTFLRQDVLIGLQIDRKFDVIVSNPPYVRNLEKAEIRPNVLDFEPHLALFVEDDDALLFYRVIGKWAKDHLTENGRLYFEINQYLRKETVELLQEIGFETVELRKDFSGNDRMICCYS